MGDHITTYHYLHLLMLGVSSYYGLFCKLLELLILAPYSNSLVFSSLFEYNR